MAKGIIKTAAMFPPANNSLVTNTGQRFGDYTTSFPQDLENIVDF